MRHNALSAHLFVLGVVRLEDVFLAVGAHLQWVEDDCLAVVIKFAGWLLHDREFGVDCGEGRVAEGIGLFDVWGDVFVGLGEVGEEGFAELLVAGGGEVEGLGAVGIRFEGCDRVVDDGVGE
jgi:hypothetical protein